MVSHQLSVASLGPKLWLKSHPQALDKGSSYPLEM